MKGRPVSKPPLFLLSAFRIFGNLKDLSGLCQPLTGCSRSARLLYDLSERPLFVAYNITADNRTMITIGLCPKQAYNQYFMKFYREFFSINFSIRDNLDIFYQNSQKIFF